MSFYDSIPKSYFKKNSERHYPNENKISIKIPGKILIVGSSGSQKTSTLMHLIHKIAVFNKIFLFCKQPDEILYSYLQDVYNKLSVKFKKEMIEVSTDINDMPDIDTDIDPDDNTLIIFDDMVSEEISKQKQISQAIIRGRKRFITTIFVSQSYFQTLPIIRKNCDYIIIKKINTNRDLHSILKEYNLGISLDQMIEMYKKVQSSGEHNFLLIDLNTNNPKLKFRINFG